MRPGSLRIAFAVLLLAFAGSAAQAQKIKVEFDKSVDFSKFKTFAWDPTPQTATARPMLVVAIKAAVSEQLNLRGLKEAADKPDVYVQIYGGVDSDAAVSYSDLYYGVGGIAPFDQSFLLWGAVPGSTTTVVVHKGELVVDIIDADRKKLSWRGKATQKLSEKRQKALEQVNTAVEKMFAEYPMKKQ
jgi:hypothetical protein